MLAGKDARAPLNMNPENWQKIKAIFNEAIELSPGEREKYLNSFNGSSGEILVEVRKLIEAEKNNSFENPIAEVSHLWRGAEEENFAGRQIGEYKITKEIGRGGMGIVFEAVREKEDYSQTFALKILKRGMDSDAMLRRFRHERRILASLEHPNIARLLDGGMTADGLSFFAMEFVEGKPLDDYCDEKDLNVAERLRLFLQVCAAVSFAHSQLVVHRDLKPTNILVTENGTVKLLDFGIAKILSPDGDLQNQTVTSLGMMTPAFASPEQIRGETVSTASDIYSLGLILFELLTGTQAHNFSTNRPDEIAKILNESEPPRPSSVISSKFRVPSSRSGNTTRNSGRQTTSSKIKTQNSKLLKGDLDNIILKALRKEPARRYISVEQFSNDISRHLEGLPVIACPDTFSYRLEKFVSRNRLSVVFGILVFISLLGGIAATSWQAVRAERQRALAEKRFAQVRELAGNVVFKYDDEIKDLQGSTKVRKILVQDALKYLDNLRLDAEGDADLTRELALAYIRIGNIQGGAYQANLGDSGGAAESYEKAIKLLEPLAENSTDTKLLAALRDAYTESGRAFFRTGEFTKQNENSQKSFELSEKIVALDPENIEPKIYNSRALVHFADSLSEKEMPRRMELYRKALRIADEVVRLAPDDETSNRMLATATHRMQLYTFIAAQDAKRNGDSESRKQLLLEALEYAKRSRQTQEKVLSMKPENPAYQRNLAGGKLNEGKIYRELGEIDTALRLANEALKVQQKIAAEDANNEEIKLDMKESFEDIAFAFLERGDRKNAFENFNHAVAQNEELLKKDPENYEFWIARLRGESSFADALLEKGDKKNARSIYEKVIDIAGNKTPKKYAEFIGKFKAEIRESLKKCSD